MAHWDMEDVQACFGDTADLNTRQITVGGQTLGLLFLPKRTSRLKFAPSVTRSTPASRSLLTPVDVSTVSTRNTA